MEDFKQKRKFHRTTKILWEQLREELDFKGSEQTIQNYISKRKKELLDEATQATLPLESNWLCTSGLWGTNLTEKVIDRLIH
ncbi:hypothetical protein [Peribacillus frigoritolerans]|uniref:hypothetical protein n=1 Tax=Peribacillus frigoritolerans TaxID=450367 RepID=UPI0024C16D9B|nr:hypothetical protein [Peribacillus frigoritolerans]WHX60499.1 hypothetical protein QNH33_17990 [Peribacillus frigoritolerans]